MISHIWEIFIGGWHHTPHTASEITVVLFWADMLTTCAYTRLNRFFFWRMVIFLHTDYYGNNPFLKLFGQWSGVLSHTIIIISYHMNYNCLILYNVFNLKKDFSVAFYRYAFYGMIETNYPCTETDHFWLLFSGLQREKQTRKKCTCVSSLNHPGTALD